MYISGSQDCNTHPDASHCADCGTLYGHGGLNDDSLCPRCGAYWDEKEYHQRAQNAGIYPY